MQSVSAPLIDVSDVIVVSLLQHVGTWVSHSATLVFLYYVICIQKFLKMYHLYHYLVSVFDK